MDPFFGFFFTVIWHENYQFYNACWVLQVLAMPYDWTLYFCDVNEFPFLHSSFFLRLPFSEMLAFTGHKILLLVFAV